MLVSFLESFDFVDSSSVSGVSVSKSFSPLNVFVGVSPSNS